MIIADDQIGGNRVQLDHRKGGQMVEQAEGRQPSMAISASGSRPPPILTRAVSV
jgi:hypothetical protein